jgi:hypothetical protein
MPVHRRFGRQIGFELVYRTACDQVDQAPFYFTETLLDREYRRAELVFRSFGL